MTATTRRQAMAALIQAQEELFDADQILSQVRTTKETAEKLRRWLNRVLRADKLISSAIENIS